MEAFFSKFQEGLGGTHGYMASIHQLGLFLTKCPVIPQQTACRVLVSSAAVAVEKGRLGESRQCHGTQSSYDVPRAVDSLP